MNADRFTLLIGSDLHYASAPEQARRGYEAKAPGPRLAKALVRAWRYWFWLRDPLAHNHLVRPLLNPPQPPDWVILNGDYSCDSAFIGVSDDAAAASVRDCLSLFRNRYPNRLRLTIGDHELGKKNLVGGCGGPRLASWHRATTELDLEPFWQLRLGRYLIIGITSTLVAWPVFQPEALADEHAAWDSLRHHHLDQIREAFATLNGADRVLLFCHDPTAIPFLWDEEVVRDRVLQIEQTIIGHLHTPLILWQSRILAGMPGIRGLGNSVRRMSTALNRARHWRPFRVRLCPSLTGCQLLKDGAYLLARLDPEGREPIDWQSVPIRWS